MRASVREGGEVNGSPPRPAWRPGHSLCCVSSRDARRGAVTSWCTQTCRHRLHTGDLQTARPEQQGCFACCRTTWVCVLAPRDVIPQTALDTLPWWLRLSLQSRTAAVTPRALTASAVAHVPPERWGNSARVSTSATLVKPAHQDPSVASVAEPVAYAAVSAGPRGTDPGRPGTAWCRATLRCLGRCSLLVARRWGCSALRGDDIVSLCGRETL